MIFYLIITYKVHPQYINWRLAFRGSIANLSVTDTSCIDVVTTLTRPREHLKAAVLQRSCCIVEITSAVSRLGTAISRRFNVIRSGVRTRSVIERGRIMWRDCGDSLKCPGNGFPFLKFAWYETRWEMEVVVRSRFIIKRADWSGRYAALWLVIAAVPINRLHQTWELAAISW